MPDATLIGRGTEYLSARIARDRPDVLERMKEGEFKRVSHESGDLPMANRWVPGEVYEPTLTEIEQACQQIRAGWDLAEHRKRAGFSAGAFAVETSTIKARDLGLDEEELSL